ncbi:DUF3800 domain-containing protein [Pseudodesulfovibrio portus]|uniref:DUF3800 domain-containing protein n=1 Tax=Pseudodesulfovibrio portus TaxID=231439 RepID=A0ABN6S0B1_9BACT|nr:DUF3800 domain-containing protein [Pseudodesulfovibrio portus]BDQ35121.1 hypothetical protein JCM14722_26630 [Pseudodesulfovibrio portus]
MRIFIDECGFTGEDLVNNEQPVYTIASLAIEEGYAQKLKKDFFSEVRTDELKHTQLRKRPRNQKFVLQFIDYIFSEHPTDIKVIFNHKKYQLVAKMADFIAETVYYNLGQDFYANGRNIAFCNVFFYGFPAFIGTDDFSHFLNVTNKMFRQREEADYNDFISLLEVHRNSELSSHINEMLMWDQQEGHQGILTLPSKALDDTISMELQLMNMWATTSTDKSFELTHDQSGMIAAHKDVWGILTSPDIAETVVGRDSRLMYFPLRVKETKLGDSKNWVGLQLVDLIAGAVTRVANWYAKGQPEDNYAESLNDIIDFNDTSIFSGLWPSTNVTPESLNAEGGLVRDPIEFMVNLLASNR